MKDIKRAGGVAHHKSSAQKNVHERIENRYGMLLQVEQNSLSYSDVSA